MLNFGNEVIEWVASVKFLGIDIDENLLWNLQSKKVFNKLAKSTYILNCVKNTLPTYCMKSLYYSLFYTHLTYVLHVWGPSISKANQNGLTKAQKKVIRIVNNTSYTAHTNELFKKLQILKFPEIIEVELCKFVYSIIRRISPTPLNSIIQLNSETHQYNTRNKNDICIPKHKSTKFNNSFIIKGPSLWSALPYDVKSKYNCIHGLANKLKKLKIDNY